MTSLRELVDGLVGEALSSTDALEIRRRIWPDGRIGEDEADLLFALNDAVAEPSREWVDCFVEALTAYVVEQAEPRFYVDERRATWLIERVRRDGRVGTLGELELLVRVLEKSLNTPESLKRFVLEEVERLVLTGEGPTRAGGAFAPGSITAGEVAFLRRALFASGGDGPARVSGDEAEALFRIKDASLAGDNSPAWRTLFVQGVGNFLMAHGGYRPLETEQAKRLERFMDDRRPNLGGFLGRLGASFLSPGRVADALSPRTRSDHDAEVAAAATVDGAEAAWLRTHVDADGRVDEYEQALLDFIASERRR